VFHVDSSLFIIPFSKKIYFFQIDQGKNIQIRKVCLSPLLSFPGREIRFQTIAGIEFFDTSAEIVLKTTTFDHDKYIEYLIQVVFKKSELEHDVLCFPTQISGQMSTTLPDVILKISNDESEEESDDSCDY
jgi:hypothetical protein